MTDPTAAAAETIKAAIELINGTITTGDIWTNLSNSVNAGRVIAKAYAEQAAELDRLKHRLTCDSCCGEKTVNCICLDSDDELHGMITGQRMGLRRFIRKQAAEIATLAAERDEARVKACELNQYKQLFANALDCVDRVFQVCTEIPNPILPDFASLGEDKFKAVIRLAKAYAEQAAELAELRGKLAAAETDLDNERSAHKETMLRCDLYFDEIAALQSDLAHARGAT
jgi:hypothetical protein